MGENICDTGRIPTIQEYCDFRKNGIEYAAGVKPQSCYDKQFNDDGSPSVVLEAADWGVIGGYFAVVLGTGLGISFFSKSKSSNATDFLLAGRSMWFLPVAFSLFSSNIGSSHFIGLAGTGAAAGIAVGAFEWNAMIILLMLGWLFVPVYLAAGISTMPEFLRKRFPGGRIRMYLATLSLFIYIFTKISADLYAGSLFLTLSIPELNIYLAVIILLAITVVYAIAGGLKAVIYVEALQTVVMVIGATILAVTAFTEINGVDVNGNTEGGWDSLWAKYECAYAKDFKNSSETITGAQCGGIRDDYDSIFRDPVDSDLPWPGMIFGLTVISTWYWCTDQVIVQRTLAAKDLSNAKIGCVLAGLIKITPMFLIIMPGMISRILFTDEVACVDGDVCQEACGSAIACSNIAYPTLVLRILPAGLRGMLMAVMLAALMSSLTSTFNSGATLFTLDIYNKIRPKASQTELMVVSRMTMLVLCAISILWLPIVQNSSDGLLFDYIQAITSYLGPPVVTVFVMGIFTEFTNEPGAFWGLIVGLVIGVFRMINEFAMPAPSCGEPDTRPGFILKVHYLYFGILLAFITLVVTTFVSLMTPRLDRKYIVRLTWWSRFSKAKRADYEKISQAHKKARFEKNPEKYADPNAPPEVNENPNILLRLCGGGSDNNTENTTTGEVDAEKVELQYDPQAAITEKKSWNIAANVMAVLCVMICVFLHGFFA